jgi:hypothetical protein
MQGQDITFLGGMNTDDDVRFVSQGDYRSSTYARSGSAEDQNMGAIESMPGNVLIDNADYPNGVNTVIGSAKWIENNSIVYFVFNDQNNHSIWTYKLDTKEIKKVISNLTVTIILPPPLDPLTAETYAGEALNFKVENKIYHANVIDNLLYWTDGFNPPRKLDLNMAIKFIESGGLSEEGYNALAFSSVEEASKTMDVLKAPPTVVIEAEYQTNPDKNFNKLYGNQYQFRYQYVYENNEESKWSMISKQPFPTVSEFVAGRNTIDALADNEIKLTYNTGSVNVRQINFAYRRGENGNWLIFKQLDKIQEGNLFPPYQNQELIFDDNSASQGATLTDILYDNVPQTAECQEILSNQSLAYANFYADYDLVRNIDITTERNLTEFYEASNNTIFPLRGINYKYEDDPTNNFIMFSITTGTSNFWYYEEGDVLVFELKEYNNNADETNSYKKYYYTITLDDIQYPEDSPYSYFSRYQNLFESIKNDFNVRYPEIYIVTNSLNPNVCLIQFARYLGRMDSPVQAVSGPGEDYAFWYSQANVIRSNKCRKSLKKGSKKVFGIQYYDRGNRSNTVQTTPEMILEVPFPGQEDLSSFQYNINEFGQSQSAYTVNPKFTINHTPPDWATHYSILVKKDELISSLMQTTISGIYPGSSVNTLVFQLDKIPIQTSVDFYTNAYIGAAFYHTPSKGDRVRFISGEYFKNPEPASEGDNASQIMPSSYIYEYKEVEVLNYDADTNQITVNEFDYIQIFGNSMLGFGTLCEIYTPKKDTAEDVWYEIEKFDIVTDGANKYHGGNTQNQTIDQPAIIESDYGDIYYRKRELATGVDFATFDNYTSMTSSDGAQKKNVISWNKDSDIDLRGTYTFTIWFNRYFGGNLLTSPTGYFNDYDSDYSNVYSQFYFFLPTMVSRFYFIEDFNYSDYYVSDSHGRGRIGIENNKTRRTHYKTGVIHSAQYVMGAFINGLSSFDTLGNAEYLDDTFGPVNRLKQVGYTLKALQDRKEVSIYIQRSYATAGDGSGQLAYTAKTFGGVNPSETLYGCTHPGSVLLIENDMYYYDYNSGTVVRSSANGQYDLTGPKYKFNYWLTNQTGLVGKVEQKNILGEPYYSKYEPIAFVDEQNTEYTLNFVKYFYPVDKPAQVLGNKIYYQYDSNIAPVFDYLEDRWKTFVDYDLYWVETLGINVFTFNQEDLYEHNIAALEDGTPNELTFYGEQKTMSIDFVMNDQPILIKRPLSIGFRSNKLFDLTEVSTKATSSYPAMKSKLFPNNFKLKEGYWWAAYLRDMTNIIAAKPSQNTEEKALINGRELRAFALLHKIEYSGNEKAILFDVKCSYVPSEAFI